MGSSRPNNYAVMEENARLLFLTYPHEKIASNPAVKFEEGYYQFQVLDLPCRVSRETGRVFWYKEGIWTPCTRPHDTLTVYDYLCDAAPDRILSGKQVTTAGLGSMVHQDLTESASPLELKIDRNPQNFAQACQTMGGIPFPSCDIGFTFRLFPDLPLTVQFWHSDEDFPPRLRYLWDTNTTRYIRYETTYYAIGLFQARLQEVMT